MNKYRQFGALDDVPEIVGDAGFTRVDMLTDPAMLPEGTLAASWNLRFDANGTTVRGGLARQFPAGTNIGPILHAGIYKPDTGDDQFALVTARSLVLFRPDVQTCTAYNFPAGEVIAAGDAVEVIQAGVASGTLPNLYLLRGFAGDVLKFDAGAVAVATGFQRGEFGLFYQDRIAVNATSQSAAVSDFLDYGAGHWSVLNQFQILKGGDDYLTCFLPYQKDYVLIGCRKSWNIAFFDPNVGTGGYDGSLKDSSFLRQLTREAGPVGPRAAIEAMGLIWFITDNAIYAFAPQLDNQLTVLGKPLSADIQPIMDRMSVKYARGACVERWGYRLYFALPISDEPVVVVGVSSEISTTVGIELPFNLPASLAAGVLVTVETATPHNAAVGDPVLLAGAVSSALNGEHDVVTVVDSTHFVVALELAAAGATVGDRMTVQRLATRNNVVAVFNLNNKGWESVDTLPAGFCADWLRTADYGAVRRLWVIDRTSGPALYEERDADETGDIEGGISLPCELPVELSEANFATTPVRGAFITRAMRWGAFPRKVKQCEVRATFPQDAAATLTLHARTPNHRTWRGAREFTAGQFQTADVPLRKICGTRALEAQVEISVTSGRPTFRSVAVETINVGKVEE